jgi:hypothetical protein
VLTDIQLRLETIEAKPTIKTRASIKESNPPDYTALIDALEIRMDKRLRAVESNLNK